MGRRAQSKRRSPLVPWLCERRCHSRARRACCAMLSTSASSRPARICTHTTSVQGTASAEEKPCSSRKARKSGLWPEICIGHHPADGQAGCVSALHHVLGQFGFGVKRDRLGDIGGLPPGRVL